MRLLPSFHSVALALATATIVVDATPAYPEGWAAPQPDGFSTGQMEVLVGTPEYHFTVAEVEDGFYTTVRNMEGWVTYASTNNKGYLVPTDAIVGRDNPPEDSLMLVEEESVRTQKCLANEYCTWKLNHRKPHRRDLEGTVKNLVIPVQFSDHGDRKLISEKDLEEDLFNDEDLSVQDYFQKQSQEKLKLVSVVAPWVQISKTEAECADGESGLTSMIHDCLHEALDLVAEHVNLNEFDADKDGKVDALTFVHSGYGAEFGGDDEDYSYYTDRIWSHSWELPHKSNTPYALFSAYHGTFNEHISRMGIAAHEIAQMLGAPTAYGDFPGYGLGYYDVMSYPFGFDGTLYHPGDMSPYTKIHMGWAEVITIDEAGTYTAVVNSPIVYKITKAYPSGEYLLIENRQSDGYDSGMRQGGLAIYHVDEAAGNEAGHTDQPDYPQNGKHYRVALLQADGRFDLERYEDAGDATDLFHGAEIVGIGPSGPIVAPDALTEHDDKYPNTNSYQGGQMENVELTIQNISPSADEMTFEVTWDSGS